MWGWGSVGEWDMGVASCSEWQDVGVAILYNSNTQK